MTIKTHLSDPAFVNPIFSANLYASGLLDEVVSGLVTPFWSQLRAQDPDAGIWAVRYSRRGEHLKIRVHSARLPSERLESDLRRLSEPVWTDVEAGDVTRVARFDIPAIDLEDEPDEEAVDRSMLITHYRRSQVTLGEQAVMENDCIVGAMHRALSEGFALCLGNDPRRLAATRQNLLAQCLLQALTHSLDRDLAMAYLTYHGDWLLRFFIPDAKKEETLRHHFETRLNGMARAVQRLGTLTQSPPANPGPWGMAIANLLDVSERHCGDPSFGMDPFASQPWQPVLFKVFHGVANSFGVKALDEAFVCRLLSVAYESMSSESTSSESMSSAPTAQGASA